MKVELTPKVKTPINLSPELSKKLNLLKESRTLHNVRGKSAFIELILNELVFMIHGKTAPPLPVHSAIYQMWAEYNHNLEEEVFQIVEQEKSDAKI